MGYMGILLFNIPKTIFYLLKGDNTLIQGPKQVPIWGLPQFTGTILGIPRISVMIFWDTYIYI